MQWRDDTTLPSRGLWLRPIGKSSECCRITVGTGKAQRNQMFSGLPPKAVFPILQLLPRPALRECAIAASRVASCVAPACGTALCPLRSDCYRIDAPPRIVAVCQLRRNALQQGTAIRSPRRRERAASPARRSRGQGAVPPGRRTVNTDPLPASLATVTSPPIMRASLRVMASQPRLGPSVTLKNRQGGGQDLSGTIAQRLNLEHEIHHTVSKLCILAFEPLK